MDASWMLIANSTKRSGFWKDLNMSNDTDRAALFRTHANQFGKKLDLKVSNLSRYLAGKDDQPNIMAPYDTTIHPPLNSNPNPKGNAC